MELITYLTHNINIENLESLNNEKFNQSFI